MNQLAEAYIGDLLTSQGVQYTLDQKNKRAGRALECKLNLKTESFDTGIQTVFQVKFHLVISIIDILSEPQTLNTKSFFSTEQAIYDMKEAPTKFQEWLKHNPINMRDLLK